MANILTPLKDLMFKYKHMLTDLPGNVTAGYHQVELTSSTPIYQKPYPIPYNARDELRKEVNDMLNMNIIRLSNSPYASPVVVVRKKDGSNRVCIDYRKLNNVCVTDPEPMARAEDIFMEIGQYKVFSKIDLSKGYWQIPVAPEDVEKTAFVTPDGHYEYIKMPFGMKNSGTCVS